jgi:single-strand DNA-binding protein
MAYAVNKVILVGNLGKDPELRYTQSGKAVAKFTVATSERGRDGNDRTEWHNIVAWEKLAELVGRLVGKGNKVYIEGRLQTREWEDKTGNRRWTTEIVAREMVFLETLGRGGGQRPAAGGDENWGNASSASPSGPADPPAPANPPAPAAAANTGSGGGEIPYTEDEDIPF